MKIKEKMTEKRMYLSPEIELIELDNEISLALESEPPAGPGESLSMALEYMNNDPFKQVL
ncbi:MAG: hypothetical protein WCG08_06115 [Paludibacter sp.]